MAPDRGRAGGARHVTERAVGACVGRTGHRGPLRRAGAAPTTQQCIDASGLDWVAEDLSDGVRLTTFGRDPAIEVLVPNAYAPAPLLLPAFADAVKVLPKNGHTCV